MARKYSSEYIQWLHDNNLSAADEAFFQRALCCRMLLWFLLSCIPGLGLFVLPVFLNTWTMCKIVKQKTFEPRPGALYSLCALAMYITFLLIAPWIIWKLAQKFGWGHGLQGMLKRGKIGNSQATAVEEDTEPADNRPTQQSKAPVIIALILILLLGLLAYRFIFNGALPFFGGETSHGENTKKDPATVESTATDSTAATLSEEDITEQIIGNWYIYGTVRQDSATARSISASLLQLCSDNTFRLDHDLCVSEADGGWHYQQMHHWGIEDGHWRIERDLLILSSETATFEEYDDSGNLINTHTSSHAKEYHIAIVIDKGEITLGSTGDVDQRGFIHSSATPIPLAEMDTAFLEKKLDELDSIAAATPSPESD